MTEEIHETVATAPSFELSPEDKAKLAKIGPSEKIKHAAMYKLIDYVMEDPEANIHKVMNMLDKLAPKNLFPTQRETMRQAIEAKSNWYPTTSAPPYRFPWSAARLFNPLPPLTAKLRFVSDNAAAPE